MIDGVLTTCRQCGADVPLTAIKGVWADGSVVHTPFACVCGFAMCFHMSWEDMQAVRDTLRVNSGFEAQGFLTADERTVLAFQEQLDELGSVGELTASWGL